MATDPKTPPLTTVETKEVPDSSYGDLFMNPRAKVAPNKRNTMVLAFDEPDNQSSQWFTNPYRIQKGNEVIAYFDGNFAFKDIVQAFRSAISSEHFIYILGWNMENFELIPGDPSTELQTLFDAAGSRGVRIRVMLFKHHSLSRTGKNNTPMVDFINEIPTGQAIHDSRVLEIDGTFLNLFADRILRVEGKNGSHHQKIIVVFGKDGLLAFQGGMDLDPNRLGDNQLLDFHTRIMGPGAHQLYSIFLDRWQDHPEAQKKVNDTLNFPTPHPKRNLFIQTTCTYGNARKHTSHGKQEAQPPGTIGNFPTFTYKFAPEGEKTCQQHILHAIRQASNFIYMEDQYLVDMDISKALLTALPAIKKLIILVCPEDSVRGEIFQVGQRRLNFLEPLMDAGKGKVWVSTHKTSFIHAKVWVFDDRFAIVGSANINRRGFSHDSEQMVGVFDTNQQRQLYWAHQIRMMLWMRHLDTLPSPVWDPIASSVLWEQGSQYVTKYVPDPSKDTSPEDLPLVPNEILWNDIIDPDGS
jgi:phosphatidylserine/phosphatidylglycerophosphate/cardiolipin synthase-like enzyme